MLIRVCALQMMIYISTNAQPSQKVIFSIFPKIYTDIICKNIFVFSVCHLDNSRLRQRSQPVVTWFHPQIPQRRLAEVGKKHDNMQNWLPVSKPSTLLTPQLSIGYILSVIDLVNKARICCSTKVFVVIEDWCNIYVPTFVVCCMLVILVKMGYFEEILYSTKG